ncbi:MAG: methyltransferase domain-containing protein [Sneathiella sp.]|nr:methyltransferase domain-containing protein [Sneathiella sp.]
MYQPFIVALFRNPKQVGAVAPSGQSLARAMAMAVDPACQTILELGPGTGVITKALLARGIPTQQLILIERDISLARLLSHRFPTTTVIPGDAGMLEQLIQTNGAQKIDAVVSSLPLLNIKPAMRTRILEQIFSLLSPNGYLIQYTYSAKAPISKDLAQKLGIEGSRITTVLRNLPPACVWKYGQSLPN